MRAVQETLLKITALDKDRLLSELKTEITLRIDKVVAPSKEKLKSPMDTSTPTIKDLMIKTQEHDDKTLGEEKLKLDAIDQRLV